MTRKEFTAQQSKVNEIILSINNKMQECLEYLQKCKKYDVKPTNPSTFENVISEVLLLAKQIVAGDINIKLHKNCINIINHIMKYKYDEKDNMISYFYKTYGLANQYRPSSYNNIFKAYKKQFPFYIRIIAYFKPNLYNL